MQYFPVPFDDLLKTTLLEVECGYCRFLNSYPPAQQLVAGGYCRWKDDNPDTWELELTDTGLGALAMIHCPEAADSITMQKVDDIVHRILQDGELRGFAVRYPNGNWIAFDENSLRMSEEEFASPGAIVLMVKMFEAELARSCKEGVYADTYAASAPCM